ncbi:MAG: SagB/ThcOx family dehydrogenase [Candidatus Saganbacteria bacterium]|nr:SagB/ThcOx family dehydrogenase [Candidatus Saganbacteria bacterium]
MARKILSMIALSLIVGGTSLAARTIDLPKPNLISKFSIEEAIFRRRSQRDFKDKEIPIQHLSQILWAAQGITDQTYGFRAAPSAGALYPLSLYIVKKDGVFRYLPDGHKLLQLQDKDIRPSLARASLGQNYIMDAPVNIIITGNFKISQAKYGPRAFRYVCMEIGHVAENIHLQAVALGLGSVPIGAFWDDVIRTNLELPETQDPLYIIPIGYIDL